MTCPRISNVLSISCIICFKKEKTYIVGILFIILGRDHCRQPERQCKFLQKMQVVKNEMFKGPIWLCTVSTWQLKNVTVFVCTYIGTKKCEQYFEILKQSFFIYSLLDVKRTLNIFFFKNYLFHQDTVLKSFILWYPLSYFCRRLFLFQLRISFRTSWAWRCGL